LSRSTPSTISSCPTSTALCDEIERVGADNKYIVMDSYRNEQEKVNLPLLAAHLRVLLHAAGVGLRARAVGYTGDYGCIYFD
jgi:hypothetical protein